MKKTFLFLSVVFCLIASSFGQGKLSSDLRSATQSAQPNEKIQIIVTLNEQYDLVSFARTTRFMSHKQSTSIAVKELRAFSNRSQQGLLQLLADEGAQVSDVYSHWLINAITCQATPQVIRDLAERPEVGMIEWDPDLKVSPVSMQEAEIDRSVTGLWSLNHIHASEVWDEYGYTGKNVLVAILDSGVCYNHVGLQGNMWNGGTQYPNHGYDFYTNIANPQDKYGRGTMVAGVVAGHLSSFRTGIAPDAQLMALRITDDDGESVNYNKIFRASEFAIEHGAQVVLISAVVAGSSQSVPFLQIMHKLNLLNIVAITAAGDAGQTAVAPSCIASPSNCPSPWHNPDETLDGIHTANICVGATNDKDQKPPFSSVGPVSWSGYNDTVNCYPYTPNSTTAVGHIRPDVAAPGTNITSFGISSSNGTYNQFSTDQHGSTSYSAAHVAGVVALLLEANSELTPAEIDRILEISAVKCGGLTLKNNYYGAGRVDALEAVNALMSTVTAPTNLTATLNQHTITLNWTASADAASYDIFCNEEYLDNVTGTSYIYEASVAGTHNFYVMAKDPNGTNSPKSNYATAFVDPDGPVVTNLNATVNDHQVTLTWEAPSPLSALRYGNAETPGNMGLGNNNKQTYWAQRFQEAELIDYIDTHIDTVQIYLRVAGTYKFFIYDGTPNGTDQKLFEKQFTVTASQVPGWYKIPVTSTVTVPLHKELWFVAWAGAAVSKPISWCSLSNPSTNAALMSEDGKNWITYSSAGTVAWMMKAHMSGGDYTYNIQRNGTQVGQNVNALTFVENNVPNGVHYYTITTNFNNGQSVSVPSEPFRVNVNIQFTVTFNAGTGTCSTPTITQSASNAAITLPTATPTSACQSAGYHFVGWSEEIIEGASVMPELMAAGSSYVPQDNVTLYAVYENIQGGGWVESRTIHSGDEICFVSREMKTEFSGFDNNNGAGASITFNNTPSGAYPFKLVPKNGKWLFQCAGGYLRKNSTGVLSLYTGSNPGATCEWSIEIVNGNAIIRNTSANSNHQLVAKQIYEYISAPTKLFACITYDEVQEHSADVMPIQLFRNSAYSVCTYDHSPSGCSSIPAPTISPVGEGYYLDPVTVKITTSVSGGQIRYTINGQDPDGGMYQNYVGTFTVNNTRTVKARVYKNNTYGELAQQTYTFPTEYANIAAFKAAANTQTVAKITSTMRVTQQYGNYIYVQDETGGLLLFDDYFFVTESFADGDLVGEVQGVYRVVDGQPMLVLWHGLEKTAGETTVEPNVVTVAQINSDYNTYDAQLVLLEGVHFAESADDFNTGVVDQDGNTIAVIDQFEGVSCAVNMENVYDVVGILGVNNGQYRIYPRTNTDIRTYYTISTEVAGEGAMEIDHTAAAEHSVVTVTVAPTEGYHLDNLYYYSTNPQQTTAIDMNTLQFEMPGNNITVVANFAVDVLYDVSFAKGSGICEVTMLSETAWHSGVVLPEAAPSTNCAAEGYFFVGWAEHYVSETLIPPTLYEAGSVYYPSANVTLYAVYAIGGTVWTDVTALAQLEESQYVITTKYATNSGQYKYYYLPHEGAITTPSASITSINAQGVPSASSHLWTISKISSTQYSITYTENGVTYYLKAIRDNAVAIEVTTSDPGVGWEFSNNSSHGLMACFPTPVAKSDKSLRYLDLYYNGALGSKWYFHTVNTYVGELHLFRVPSNTYATAPSCQASVEEPSFVSLPEGVIYEDSYEVALAHADSEVTIHYTLDGSDPTANSPVYVDPIVITDDVTVKAIAIDSEGNSSNIISHFFDFITRYATIAQFKSAFNATSSEVVKITGMVTAAYHSSPYLYVCDTEGLMIRDDNGVITRDYTNGMALINGLIGRMVVEHGQKMMVLVEDPGQGMMDVPVQAQTGVHAYDLDQYDALLVKMAEVEIRGVVSSKDGVVYEVRQGSTSFYVCDLFGHLTQTLEVNAFYDITGFVGSPDIANTTRKCLYPRQDSDFTRYYNVVCDTELQGGTVSVESAHYLPGATVTVTPETAAHYEFGSITVTDADNQPVEVIDNSFVMPASDVTVTATFLPMEYVVEVSISPMDAGYLMIGEVTFSQGDVASYHYGDMLQITAVPASGYEFHYMYVGNDRYDEPSVAFELAGETHIYVRFEEAVTPPTQYTVTAEVNPEEAGEVMGAGTFDENTEVTLTATAAAGYEFVNWTVEGEEVGTDAEGYTFTLTADVTVVANFQETGTQEETQEVTLNSGWEWFSSYVEMPDNALELIMNSISNDNQDAIIKSQSDGYLTLANGDWSGTLESLQNEKMYLISTEGGFMSLTAPLADPADHPITLGTGWNWIGYISSEMMPVEEALASLNPEQEDMIKAQTGFASYTNGEWSGSLTHLKPGTGYIYLSNADEAMTLIYPTPTRSYVADIPAVTHWNANHYLFPTNLTMMVTLDAEQFVMGEGSHEIGAFVNGECRGTALLQTVKGQYVAFLTVSGKQGEEVSFRLFDVNSNEEKAGFAEEQIIYRADDIYGSVKHPMTLHFRNTGVNEYYELSLYPNPTSGKVILQGQAIEMVNVYNAMGQLVLTEEYNNANQVELNLGHLNAGVYTVNVRMTNGQQSNRMVVVR